MVFFSVMLKWIWYYAVVVVEEEEGELKVEKEYAKKIE